MPTSDAKLDIAGLEEVDFREVLFYEVSAVRHDASGVPAPRVERDVTQNLELEISSAQRENELGVRCRIQIHGTTAQIIVDLAVVFDKRHKRPITDSGLSAVVEHQAIPIAVPYMQEAVNSLAGRVHDGAAINMGSFLSRERKRLVDLDTD